MADGTTPGGGWVPVPDPTALTAEAVATAKDELRRELAATREILETRMRAMDQERRSILRIMDEQKTEIERRFIERDSRYDERDRARQDAVLTALNAARELNDARDAATEQASQKFEAAIREQIQQTAVLFQAGRERLDTKIEGLKERIDRGEGGTTAASVDRAERRLDYGNIVALVSALIAAAAVIVLIVKH
jgi:hypothetical protein